MHFLLHSYVITNLKKMWKQSEFFASRFKRQIKLIWLYSRLTWQRSEHSVWPRAILGYNKAFALHAMELILEMHWRDFMEAGMCLFLKIFKFAWNSTARRNRRNLATTSFFYQSLNLNYAIHREALQLQ